MTFIDCFTLLNSGLSPLRAYVHRLGFSEIYHSRDDVKAYAQVCLEEAKRKQGGLSLPFEPAQSEWMVGIFWGDVAKREKVADFMGYAHYTGWPGIPDAESFVMREGRIVSPSIVTCGDGILAMGFDEGIRRKSRDLKDYLSRDADLDVLNKMLRGE